jgi:hypothetical protein
MNGIRDRQIKQISNGGTILGREHEYDVVALCYDGTLWAYSCDRNDNMNWIKLPPIPQDSDDEK